jgi:5'-nucleotidase
MLVDPTGTMDRTGVDTVTQSGAVREIKEWQAIMDHLRGHLAIPQRDP